MSRISDDTESVASSSSSKAKFSLPDHWRPAIMACINAESESEQRRLLVPEVRNSLVRDLVTTLYAAYPAPKKEQCTMAARTLAC